MVNRDEFGSVGKGGFYLNFVNHFRNAFHDLLGFQQVVP
jgi:hypothetical protein